MQILPDKEMLEGIHRARPLVRLLHCWPEIVPEWHLFLDIPDIVFKVEQDVDGDGALEIIATSRFGRITVFNNDGSTASGWPVIVSNDPPLTTPALADLDGDGDLEIVAGSDAGKVHAWHHDGSTVSGWPKSVGAAVEASPAASDVDADGSVEVVIGATDGKMYAWRGNATALAGWPVSLGSSIEITSSAALGDLDGDADMEIVVGTRAGGSSSDNKVHAWHHDATTVSGWPQAFETPPSFGAFHSAPGSVDLADVDGDDALEVVVMSNDDKVHIWEDDGTTVAGWPPAGLGLSSAYELFVSSPVIADIDGDDDRELVFEGASIDVSGHKAYAVYAYHHDGTAVTGWPKVVNSFSNSSPTIADLDQDDTVEVLIGSDGLFVWDLAGSWERSSPEWPFYREDNPRSGAYGPMAGVALLMDTSGSMSWLADGSQAGPGEDFKKRISLARQAAIPFMQLLKDFGEVEANYGIATFPSHPFSGCQAEVVTPMALVTQSSKDQAVNTTIPGLTTGGSTPLIAGMDKAVEMFGKERRAAIVLLSDGYHNCPGKVSVGDPEVADLVGKLQGEDIRVFSIGFGRPSDVDHPLLKTLASATTPSGYMDSQFYDVTTPAFDPMTWDPATALQSTYKNILVDALGLNTTTDPLERIGGGEREQHTTHLTRFAHKVSYFVSWKTPEPDRLRTTVKASDGSTVTAGQPGVTVHEGETYRIVTVERRLLQQAGKVTGAPWTLEVQAGEFEGSEPYQYSVIVDSSLRLQAGSGRHAYGTGDVIRVTARLSANGRPLTRPARVEAVVTAPEEGLGNWFVENPVERSQLEQAPAQRNGESLRLWQRQAHYLTQIQGISPPGAHQADRIQLYDDGTHGDKRAGDGAYTNLYRKTQTPGTYSFHVQAAGRLGDGQRFERDSRFQKRVEVAVASGTPRVEVESFENGQAVLKVFPRDRFGNFLAPGRAQQLKLRIERAQIDGSIENALNGGYRVPVSLPQGAKPNQLKVRTVLKDIEPARPRPGPGKAIPRDIVHIERAWLDAYLKALHRRPLVKGMEK